MAVDVVEQSNQVLVTNEVIGTLTITDDTTVQTVSITEPSAIVSVVDTNVVVQVTEDAAQSVVVENPTTNVTVGEDQVTLIQVTGIGPQGAQGLAVGIYQTVNTYAIGGELSTTDFVPPFFFAKKDNQVSVLKKIIHRINSGTSATVKLQKNGVDISGYTGVSVTTTTATTSQDTSLVDGDMISLVITAVSGTPSDLTVTLVIEHTIT